MRRLSTVLLLAGALVPAFAQPTAAAQAPGQDPQPEVGQPFPILEFPRLGEAGLGSLADHRGRKVLLVQFASW